MYAPLSLARHGALSATRTFSPRDRALTWSFWVTHPERGITRDDVAHLDAWLAFACSPEGHETLRRERRRSQRTQARYSHGTLARVAKWERAYKLAEALLEEANRSLAALIAGSVRDDTFDRTENATSIA